jgi:ABC-type cobalamin/Fe3+-siderophores transport system ATPase subunit
MSPEELATMKAIVEEYKYPENGWLKRAIAHIDEQDINIEKLERCIENKNARIQELESDFGGLLSNGKEQIALLKAALIEERACHLIAKDRPCDAMDRDDHCGDADTGCCWASCPKKDEKRVLARTQLKSELPETDWP